VKTKTATSRAFAQTASQGLGQGENFIFFLCGFNQNFIAFYGENFLIFNQSNFHRVFFLVDDLFSF
jgi:hypothetical protein